MALLRKLNRVKGAQQSESTGRGCFKTQHTANMNQVIISHWLSTPGIWASCTSLAVCEQR